MGQKLIVPIAAVVLALGGGVAIWFLMQGDAPHPAPPAANDTPAANAPEVGPLQLNPADFDPARLEPDPVISERPPQPYTAPDNALRIVISGRVADESGAGITDVRVTFTGDQRLRELRGAGFTDAAGNYRLLAWSSKPAAAGERKGRVSAEAPDGAIAVGEVVSIPDADSAEMPELVIARGAAIEGQVLSDDGTPVAGAKVTARSAGPVQVVNLRGRGPEIARRQLVRTVFADHTGRYRFAQLPAATYSVQAEGAYFGANRETNPVDVSRSDYGWLELKLKNENYVRGVLQDQAGTPIPGAVVQLIRKAGAAGGQPADTSAKLTPMDSADLRRNNPRRFDDVQPLNPINNTRVVTDSAGRFGFSKLADAEYTIAAKLGDAEARHEGARINQPDYLLQIEVSTSLSGVVTDAETGRPIESFDVRVMRMDSAPQATPFDRVADDGLFEHHPGGVYLLANPPLEGAVVRICAPGYAPVFLGAGELRPGDQRRNLDAALQPLCELTFELVHEGRKLDLEPVALLFQERLAFETSSDELARVRIPRVSPAAYKVKVTLADGTQLEGSLTVPARREAALTLTLASAG